MDAQETAELIEQSGHDNKQQNRSALTISILAMVLAIASLGGSNAMKEATQENILAANAYACLLYTSPSPRDRQKSRMPSSA